MITIFVVFALFRLVASHWMYRTLVDTSIPRDPIYTNSTDFTTVAGRVAFIDKTLLIKEILDDVDRVVYEVPEGCGKSTTLDMLKSFLEIPTNSTMAEKARLLFTKMRLYREERECYETHFGRYPVLLFNFGEDLDIDDSQDVLEELRRYIIEMYSKNTFLLDSPNLNANEIYNYRQWVNRSRLFETTMDEIKAAIPDMIRYVYKYYGNRKVILLVDNPEAYIRCTVHGANQRDMEIIDTLVRYILSTIVNNEYAERVVVTSDYLMTYFAIPLISNVTVRKYLQDDWMTYFFCFSDSEANRLFSKFHIKDFITTKQRQYFNRMEVKENKYVHTMTSILQYIEQQDKIKFFEDRFDF